MPTTPNAALPYPVLTDTPDVPRDIKALAERLDALLVAPPSGGGGAGLAQLPVLDVGLSGQNRAGRQLTATDFTSLGLAAPLGLWNLSSVNDVSGNARHLTNKGAVPFGTGINGAASTAAVFSGSTAQALYIADVGAADPFRIRTGSWGCWLRTAKRGTRQDVLAKAGAASNFAFVLDVSSTNVANCFVSSDGSATTAVAGISDVCDDRWHHTVATFDGTTVRLYVDGVLESMIALSGVLFSSPAPLNIGAIGADGSTAAGAPHYGRVDEAFVTADVLSEEQVRNLYCVKVAHGYTLPPGSVRVSVRRRRRGATFAVADFPAQPLRLHNFTAGALTDEGSGGAALTNNGTAVAVAGADGALGNAFSFAGAQSLSATDAGLPAGTAARSYGCWLKTTNTATAGTVVAWGTFTTADARLWVNATGPLICSSGADNITAPYVADGQWHLAVATEDNVAGDGVRRKLYLDGRLVGASTVLNAITLVGANRFRVGAAPDGTGSFIGQVDGAFVCGYALTFEQVAALWAKGSQALAASPKNAGDHVEAVDNTSLYCVFDTLDSTAQVDLGVAA